MGRRIRVAAALVICLLGLAACGFGPRPDGLPGPAEEAEGAASPGPITGQPPPPTTLDARGPASIVPKEFYFEEAGQHTAVDLERAGLGTADVSYDHVTGALTPINGAKVSLYDKNGWGWWDEPSVRSDYPGEQECRQKPDEDWRDAFSEDDLTAEFSIYCIRMAGNTFGFLVVKPIPNQKPNAYYVYSYTWVR